MNREEVVRDLFIDRGVTLSVAESCTGGALAARLVSVPGASQYFSGGIVAYFNDIKQRVLGVPNDILDRFGAVSKEVVECMAEGAIKVFHTDYSVAVSGVAGPSGGSEDKPVGTVWASIVHKDGNIISWTFHAPGDRVAVIKYSVNEVLESLSRIA